jgi:hypothetical protein
VPLQQQITSVIHQRSKRLVSAVLAMTCVPMVSARQDPARLSVKSPLVTVVGCAATTAQPHLWSLTHAGERSASPTAGITSLEAQDLKIKSLGRATYQLIGVADFVDVDTARRIGVRDKILSPSRMNTTGRLVDGHKVAVRGLYIEAQPPRINLTSVVDLGGECP